MLSRDQSLRPETWNLLGTSGNVFDSPRATINSSSTPYQGMLHSWNQSAAGENPVRDSAGKLVARTEEGNRETIPTPRFVRRPSTMNSFFPAESYPQNYVAEINQDFRSRSFNLTNSPHLQRFHVGNNIPNPSISAWRLCYGSKMRRWSIQWMN